MREFFPGQNPSGGRVKIELDLSNYATETELKYAKVLIRQNLLKKLI